MNKLPLSCYKPLIQASSQSSGDFTYCLKCNQLNTGCPLESYTLEQLMQDKEFVVKHSTVIKNFLKEHLFEK